MDLQQYTDLAINKEQLSSSRGYINGQKQNLGGDPKWLSLLGDFKTACDELKLGIGQDQYLAFNSQLYRVHLELSKGGEVYCLRRMPGFKPNLVGENPEGIVFPEIISQLVNENTQRDGGLILISGPLGVGKTTASAAVLNYLLSTKGGVAWALEDPPEYDMEGDYGENGVCYQRHVMDGDFSTAIRSMMRCFPAKVQSTLFVGEVRDRDTAIQVLQALLNGTRVIFTFHASGTVDSLTRFLTLCDGQEYARLILGESLRLAINISKKTQLGKTRLGFSFLAGGQRVAQALRDGQFVQLDDIARQQANIRQSQVAMAPMNRD